MIKAEELRPVPDPSPKAQETALLTAQDTAKLLPQALPPSPVAKPKSTNCTLSAQRDAHGHLLPGHKALPGAGNPYAKEVHKIKQMIFKVCTPKELEKCIRKALELAQGGDLTALRIVLEYSCGKPANHETLELKAGAENQQINIVLGGQGASPQEAPKA